MSLKKGGLSMRAEKKILSRMSSRKVVKVFSSDRFGALLDNLYKLCKIYTKEKSEAEHVVNNTIKIFSKIRFLHENKQLSDEEIALAHEIDKKFRKIAESITSCYEHNFILERKQLANRLEKCKTFLSQLVQRHLTHNTLTRIAMVFNFFSNSAFLDAVFKKNSEYRNILKEIISDIPWLLHHGLL